MSSDKKLLKTIDDVLWAVNRMPTIQRGESRLFKDGTITLKWKSVVDHVSYISLTFFPDGAILYTRVVGNHPNGTTTKVVKFINFEEDLKPHIEMI